MAESNFTPNLGEIFEVTSSQVNLFRGINSPGYVIGDIAITPAGATYEWDGDSWNSISFGAGGGGAQTPWASNINGGGFNLTNVGIISSGLFGGDAVLVTSLTGEIEESTVGAGELGFLTGVTSAIQTQLNARALLTTNTFTGLQTITQATTNTGILASTGYSLTGSNATNMLDLAGTWNTSGNPVALKLAISNTASGATSKFLSFLAGAGGATEVLSVDKAGKLTLSGGNNTIDGGATATLGNSGTTQFGWNANGVFARRLTLDYANADVTLERDAANTLALRNSTNAQRIRIYNSFTTLDTAGEWFKFDWIVTANQFRFGAVRGSSSGTSRAASWDYGAVAAGPTAAITVPATSGNIVFGGGVQLSNAAVTGLSAGALAATTNASIVLYDSSGQAYRVPCII